MLKGQLRLPLGDWALDFRYGFKVGWKRGLEIDLHDFRLERRPSAEISGLPAAGRREIAYAAKDAAGTGT